MLGTSLLLLLTTAVVQPPRLCTIIILVSRTAIVYPEANYTPSPLLATIRHIDRSCVIRTIVRLPWQSSRYLLEGRSALSLWPCHFFHTAAPRYWCGYGPGAAVVSGVLLAYCSFLPQMRGRSWIIILRRLHSSNR